MIKLDWLDASASPRVGGIALVFLYVFAYNFRTPLAKGRQAQVTEEIYQCTAVQ
jgi:hypothetical protein